MYRANIAEISQLILDARLDENVLGVLIFKVIFMTLPFCLPEVLCTKYTR